SSGSSSCSRAPSTINPSTPILPSHRRPTSAYAPRSAALDLRRSSMATDDLDLPERARQFCIDSLPAARRIRPTERLRGGIAAVTHLVEIDRSGDSIEVVLRRFVRQGGMGWPPIDREVAVLAALQGHSAITLVVPSVIAYDRGERCDVSAILLSRV